MPSQGQLGMHLEEEDINNGSFDSSESCTCCNSCCGSCCCSNQAVDTPLPSTQSSNHTAPGTQSSNNPAPSTAGMVRNSSGENTQDSVTTPLLLQGGRNQSDYRGSAGESNAVTIAALRSALFTNNTRMGRPGSQNNRQRIDDITSTIESEHSSERESPSAASTASSVDSGFQDAIETENATGQSILASVAAIVPEATIAHEVVEAVIVHSLVADNIITGTENSDIQNTSESKTNTGETKTTTADHQLTDNASMGPDGTLHNPEDAATNYESDGGGSIFSSGINSLITSVSSSWAYGASFFYADDTNADDDSDFDSDSEKSTSPRM